MNDVNKRFNNQKSLFEAVCNLASIKPELKITNFNANIDPVKILAVKSLNQNKLFLLNTRHEMFIADIPTKQLNNIVIPDSVYYKYCNKNDEIVQSYVERHKIMPITVLSALFAVNDTVNMDVWLCNKYYADTTRVYDSTYKDTILMISNHITTKNSLLNLIWLIILFRLTLR